MHLCRVVHGETTLLVSCFSSPRKPADPLLQSPGRRMPTGLLWLVVPPLLIFIRRCPQVREHVASHHAERPLGYFALRWGWRRRIPTAWMLSLQCTHVYFMRGRECKLHFSHHVVYIYIFFFPRWKRVKKIPVVCDSRRRNQRGWFWISRRVYSYDIITAARRCSRRTSGLIREPEAGCWLARSLPLHK